MPTEDHKLPRYYAPVCEEREDILVHSNLSLRKNQNTNTLLFKSSVEEKDYRFFKSSPKLHLFDKNTVKTVML